MASVEVRLEERRVPVEPKALLPGVAAYCRELFPSHTQITCNSTRVEATFELGEGVEARVVVDVDPAYDDAGVTRLSGSFRAYGEPLREADKPVIEAMAAQLFDGLTPVVEAAVRRRGIDAGGRGLG